MPSSRRSPRPNIKIRKRLRYQKKFVEARTLLEEAVELKKDQRLERCRSMLSLGIIDVETGDLDGRKRIEEALKEFESMGAEWDVENAKKASIKKRKKENVSITRVRLRSSIQGIRTFPFSRLEVMLLWLVPLE